MKTVKFKELPEKVQEFLQREVLGYFVAWECIGLKVLHELEFWPKATDEERLAYAKWKYPIGTYYIAVLVDDICMSGEKCISDSPPIADFVEPEGKVVEVGFGYVYSDKTGWAEIIEEPEKEDVEMNASIKRDVEQVLAEDSEPTFKAGDEVDCFVENGSEKEWIPAIFYAKAFHEKRPWKECYVVAYKNTGNVDIVTELRKPDPDASLKEIAKEILKEWDLLKGEDDLCDPDVYSAIMEMGKRIEALKKGKEL